MNTLQARDGAGQETGFKMTISKPLIPKNGNPYYNPSTYINTHLNMPNKRRFMKPDNYVGFKSFRPDNMQPNRQHIPSGLVWDPIKEGIPILKTPPISKIYN